ncbi:hypothetical protein GCM10023320_49880 [Pseudonocardia adelaidensis]|uniref:Uncharacterized protein n=1 Tax=Pseudonocardia adelaidensis TaxID=648754 RepID=A0ABP9NQ16_9PSEU
MAEQERRRGLLVGGHVRAEPGQPGIATGDLVRDSLHVILAAAVAGEFGRGRRDAAQPRLLVGEVTGADGICLQRALGGRNRMPHDALELVVRDIPDPGGLPLLARHSAGARPVVRLSQLQPRHLRQTPATGSRFLLLEQVGGQLTLAQHGGGGHRVGLRPLIGPDRLEVLATVVARDARPVDVPGERLLHFPHDGLVVVVDGAATDVADLLRARRVAQSGAQTLLRHSGRVPLAAGEAVVHVPVGALEHVVGCAERGHPLRRPRITGGSGDAGTRRRRPGGRDPYRDLLDLGAYLVGVVLPRVLPDGPGHRRSPAVA